MFKHLFATMHEVLDEIIRQYPASHGAKKQELEEQIGVLKTMSDSCIEEWLHFEEKLEKMTAPLASVPAMAQLALPAQAAKSDAFVRGQGYYQLLMYEQAVMEFEQVVKKQPDFLLARLYLAMGYMRKGDYAEAYRHFQLLTSLTEHKKMKAISYNAMGCIQAKNKNLEKAQEYFKLAYKVDPSFMEPLMNMGISIQDEEKLLFDTGLPN